MKTNEKKQPVKNRDKELKDLLSGVGKFYDPEYNNTDMELFKAGKLISYFAWKIQLKQGETTTDFWTNDLTQTGIINFWNSRLLGFSISQSIAKSYYQMKNEYNRVFLNSNPNNKNIVQIVRQDQENYCLDLFPAPDTTTANIDQTAILKYLDSALTGKQFIILTLLLSGYNQNEIAQELNITHQAVYNSLKSIRNKTAAYCQI